MDLEELKDIWKQYDKKLDSNLKINEELLRKTNLDKTRKELRKPYYYEISSVVICMVMIFFLVAWSVTYINELKFSLPGFMAVALLIPYFIMSYKKTKLMAAIEYFTSPAVQVQKRITHLKVQIMKFRKIELILMPFLVVFVLPILFKAIHNVDLYEQWWLFAIELVIILGISIPLVLWLNKHLYDNKLKNAQAFMEDIQKFETDQ
ncbi:MAG: hypothetical protein JEZ03_07575 [Bacteroidales bacterium]|nr:hypothetical protein [Bacteroidales bacterium]